MKTTARRLAKVRRRIEKKMRRRNAMSRVSRKMEVLTRQWIRTEITVEWADQQLKFQAWIDDEDDDPFAEAKQ